MKKMMAEWVSWLYSFLKLLPFCSFGVFLGHGVYLLYDVHTNPTLYEIRSAPWYMDLLVYGGACVGIWLLCTVLRFFIKKYFIDK